MDEEQDGGLAGDPGANVAVAGAGLAGLTAARRLAERGHDVTVYEARDIVGGRVRSRHLDGWTFDRGFQVLFTAYPAVQRELDLEALDLRRYRPGAVLANAGGRSVVADPLRDPRAALATLRNSAVPLRDGLRMLLLRWRLGRCSAEALRHRADAADGRSIRAYLDDAGFSDRIVERFLAPFYGGITLDRSLATSAFVFVATFGALSRGAIAVPKDGMGAIPEQLAEAARRAGAAIATGRAVGELEPTDGGVALSVDGETVSADAAVVATDPPTARELTGVEAVPAAGPGCVTQHVAVDEELGAGRRLVLRSDGDGDDGGAPAHVAPASTVAPGYAPDDRELVTATYLGEPDADDEALAARTRAALADWFPDLALAPEVLRTDRVPFAQFAQPPGFRGDRPDLRDPDGTVYLAGDHTAWSSIQGALASGREAAVAIHEDRGA